MTDEKICPLQQPRQDCYGMYQPVPCTRERCAWWCYDGRGDEIFRTYCAVPIIAIALSHATAQFLKPTQKG